MPDTVPPIPPFVPAPVPEPERTVSAGMALVRVVVFLALAYTLQFFSFLVLMPFGPFVGATIGSFAGGLAATALVIRIYHAGSLGSLGLAWHRSAAKHAAFGFAMGAGAGAIVLGVPLAIGLANWVPAAEYPFSWSGLLFVSIVLLFGALGEELIFRGYPFQFLAGRFGVFQILLPAAVLFAAAHSGNLGSSQMAMGNTFLWGVLFGYAVLRTGDLWMATAIHFGWNFTLPLFGVPLSGFKMGLTGRSLAWQAGPLWSGGDYGPEAGVPATLIVAILFLLLHKLPVDRQRLPLLADPTGESEESEV